jgi:GNAT superfamily N-acetyltransferase
MFTIRKATADDSSLIRELASHVWSNTYAKILSKEQLDYMFEMMYSNDNILKQMNELHHQFFIISVDNEPAGYLSVETKSPDLFNFQKIYSLPQWHGSGIGRYIIEQGIAWIKSFHPEPFTVELYVNRYNPAVGFYKHMGFKEVATRDHAIGNGYFMNDYIMELPVE